MKLLPYLIDPHQNIMNERVSHILTAITDIAIIVLNYLVKTDSPKELYSSFQENF